MALSDLQLIHTPLPGKKGITTASEQQRYAKGFLVGWYAAALSLTSLLCAVLVLLGPGPAAIGWIVFLTLIALALYNPRYGLYALIVFALMIENLMAPWYPFMKNLSSAESMLFLHDAAIVNPAEVIMVAIIVSWLGRMIITRKFSLYTGPLFISAFAFISFVAFGFLFGISRGGDLNIALWEARAIFYLPLVLLLVSNLVQTREHIMHLVWCVVIALSVSGLQGFLHVAIKLQWDIKSVLEIAYHPYSIYLNGVFVLVVALFYFRGSPSMRWFLLVTVPIMLIPYIYNQRRAGYVALAVAFLVLGLLSQWFSKRIFWALTPPLLLVFAIYVGAFWNSTAPPAVIAQQVRSIVAPVEGSEEESSNLYRELENANILYTIQQMPLTGVGFGRKFLIIAPMADISFFAWWEYITHNSIVWIWMQTGIGGFLAMIAMIGTAISVGIRNVFRVATGDMRAIAFAAVGYVLMHFTFAYVDMSWSGEGMIYLGTILGVINILERVVARPVALPKRRWPWQREPEQPPGMYAL